MKKLLIIFTVLVSGLGFAQSSLEGKFAINFLITDLEVTAYTLYPRPCAPYIYGNSVTFGINGTFSCGYAAPCGNDCFTHSWGTYTMPDADHIRFVVDTVTVTGDCQHKNYNPHKDLGTYLVIRDEQMVQFIKSDGNAEHDRAILSYPGVIDSYDAGLFSKLSFKASNAAVDAQIITALLAGNKDFDLTAVKLLFTKFIDNNYYKLILFEHRGKQHLVVYIVCSGYAALYDPAAINR